MKTKLFDLIAWLWFLGVLVGNLLMMILGIFIIVFLDILPMLKSGFAVSTIGFAFCFFVGIVFAITGWIPVFRRCYYIFPWLYPCSMLLTMHLYILSMAEVILAKGFQVMSTPRHIITIILVVVQLVLCRAVMCIYLKKHPMALRKYDRME